MDEIEVSRARAKRYLHVADHMVYMTYGVVKDSKILLSVMDSIFLSLTNCMTALLEQEKKFKAIPLVPKGFEAKFMLFRDVAQKFKLDDAYISMMRDVKDTILDHKTSPVAFRRKEQYVICSDSYHMRTINVDQIKEYLRMTREFFSDIQRLTSKSGVYAT
jgi:hypothetical protein